MNHNLFYRQGTGVVCVNAGLAEGYLIAGELGLKPEHEGREWWVETAFTGDPDQVPGIYVHRPSGVRRVDHSRIPTVQWVTVCRMLTRAAGFKVTIKI